MSSVPLGKEISHSSPINFLQPVGELARLGPTGFNKQIEYLQQSLEALRVFILENFTVIGDGTLNELNDGCERQRVVLEVGCRAGADRLRRQEKYFARSAWHEILQRLDDVIGDVRMRFVGEQSKKGRRFISEST